MTKLSCRFFVPAALTILLALSGCGGSSSGAKDPSSARSGEGSGHAEIGQQAPDLTIQTVNGKGTISLESLRGKVVLVDFWATWCAPCKQSFPRLEELGKQVGADKLVIIGVSVDDDKAGVAEFAKENGATFAVGWDEGHTIAGKWKFGTMPTTFVVDPSGKIRHIHDGYRDGETNVMSKEITALLDGSSGGGETRVAKNEPHESKPAVTDDKPSHDDTATPAKKPKKKGGRGAGKKHPPKKKAKKA